MSNFKKIETVIVENEFCQYWFDENGVLHEIFKPSFDILTLEIAQKITKDRIEVSNGVFHPLYVELGKAVKMERKANQYLSTGEAMTYLTATGILVRDHLEKFGAIMYTKFFKPSIPTKFFTKKDMALVWLSQFSTEKQN